MSIADRLRLEAADAQVTLQALLADTPGAAAAIKDEATRRDVLTALGSFNRALLGGAPFQSEARTGPLWQRLNREGHGVATFWKGTLGGLRQLEDGLSEAVRLDYALAVDDLFDAFGLPRPDRGEAS